MVYLVSAIFGLWFFLSVITQFSNSWVGRIRQLDYFNLLPAWTFFAPHPDYYDYHLLYRDENNDGSMGEFLEVEMHHVRWYKFIWNPSRRMIKSLMDCSQMALRLKGNDILETFPYVLLANYVLHLPHATNARYTQFAIYRTEGEDLENAKKILISGLISLPTL